MSPQVDADRDEVNFKRVGQTKVCSESENDTEEEAKAQQVNTHAEDS